MAEWTVEYTFLVPHYVHETFEAPNKAAAIAEAERKLKAEDINWLNQEKDYDNSRNTVITGMWKSAEAYSGTAIDVPGAGHPEEIIPEMIEMLGNLAAALRNACGGMTKDDRAARLNTVREAYALIERAGRR